MVKYRSKLVRGYGKDGSGFYGKDAQWLNFWLLISAIFTFLFFVMAFNQADTNNPVVGIISLLGFISLFPTPMLFCMVLGAGKFSEGLPDLSSLIRKKTDPIYSTKPLKGYEDCSPQYQAYMRAKLKKKIGERIRLDRKKSK